MSAALLFERVSASYGARRVLHGVTAGFVPGSVTGLVGPNGAGKTTLLRVALGFLVPDSGAVNVLGKPLAEWTRETLARNIAYLPQSSEAEWPVPARKLVALGRLPFRAPLAPLSRDDEMAIDAALDRCDARAFASRRMDELSAGERARVLFARALATRAPILLADEPAAHLDPAHQLRLMELLGEEARRGAAVAVTLHDLSLASRFCHALIVLKQGQVASRGAPGAALSDSTLAETFGISAVRMDSAGGAIVPWQRLPGTP
ncbi:MAG TPA: ABC transporter ATP-binding protein [Rhizomicrobium sp.]|nr:ABC transporter ATP-binding protein [Rhizomicrobium sp.]